MKHLKTKLHRPRDPSFVEMVKRVSGAHGKTKKALRKGEKQKLRKEIQNVY